jgi:hypothetical protein
VEKDDPLVKSFGVPVRPTLVQLLHEVLDHLAHLWGDLGLFFLDVDALVVSLASEMFFNVV